MAYEAKLRDIALEDLQGLPKNLQRRILKAIDQRLQADPARYGERLRKSLTGLWKMRVGDYRVVYEIRGSIIEVWAILHRKFVYQEVERRFQFSE